MGRRLGRPARALGQGHDVLPGPGDTAGKPDAGVQHVGRQLPRPPGWADLPARPGSTLHGALLLHRGGGARTPGHLLPGPTRGEPYASHPHRCRPARPRSLRPGQAQAWSQRRRRPARPRSLLLMAQARPVTDTSTRRRRSRLLSSASLRQQIRSRPNLLPPALLVVAAGIQSVVVLRLAHRSWFGVDAVSYLTTRGPVPSADVGLFKPYGGHWLTIPLLVYRGLFEIFGMRSYLPYVAVALAVHLAIVFVLYALLRSVGARPWIAFGTSWLVLFYGAGSEAFMWDAPMVLTSALVLGLVAMLVMVRRHFSLGSRILGGVLLLAAVMCSGTGLVAAVTVGCFVLLRVGLRSALIVGAPAVIAFSVWFFTVGRDGRVDVSSSRIPEIPAFVWKGLTGSLGSLVGIPGTGALLLLVLVGVLLWPVIEAVALRQLALAGLLGAGTQLVLSSFASLVGGTSAARVGRYEYLVLVLLAASVALALETVRGLVEQGRIAPGLRGALPVVGVLVLAATTLQGVSQERRQADFGAANARL